jgi:hypothetical protein
MSSKNFPHAMAMMAVYALPNCFSGDASDDAV